MKLQKAAQEKRGSELVHPAALSYCITLAMVNRPHEHPVVAEVAEVLSRLPSSEREDRCEKFSMQSARYLPVNMSSSKLAELCSCAFLCKHSVSVWPGS